MANGKCSYADKRARAHVRRATINLMRWEERGAMMVDCSLLFYKKWKIRHVLMHSNNKYMMKDEMHVLSTCTKNNKQISNK